VPSVAQREAVESLASRLYDDVTVTEVIRPAAVLSESNARRVLDGLKADDVRSGGRWHAEPGCWRLFERPWKGKDERSAAAGRSPSSGRRSPSSDPASGTPSTHCATKRCSTPT
jgi:hypothetical protein